MNYPAESEVRAGLAAYNRFVARMWIAKQEEIGVLAKAAVEEALLKEKRAPRLERIELDLEKPPRLEFEGALAKGGRLKVHFRLPGDGSWTVRVHVRVRVGFLTSKVKVSVQRLRISATLELDRTSPVSATLIDTKVKVDLGDVKVDASNLLLKIFGVPVNILLEVLEGTIEALGLATRPRSRRSRRKPNCRRSDCPSFGAGGC